MLTYLRKKQRAILKWTLIAVIPSFIAFYGWSEITGAGPSAEDPNAWWIRVKGNGGGWVEVSQWEFRQAKDTLLNRYASMMQSQLGPQAGQYVRQVEGLIGNERVALEAIDNAILRRYAEERGLTVSVDEVTRTIQQQFRGLTKQQAQQYVANQGMSEQQFKAQLGYSMLLEKARREVTAPAFVSVFEVWQEYSLGKQKVKVAALEFSQMDFMDSIAVDDGALGEYFKENVETYRVPEKRAYEYVKIDRAALRDAIEVDEAALKEYYAAHSEEFQISKGVKVRQIVLNVAPGAEEAEVEAVRQDIEGLAGRAKGGEDFAALADEFTQDFSNTIQKDPDSTATILLGGLIDRWITESDSTAMYGEAFVKAALALKAGEISEPVRTLRGWAVLKAEEVREASLPAFEDVKGDVEGRYRDVKSKEIYAAERKKLAEAISNFTDLSEIAEATGLTIQKTEPQPATNFNFPQIGMLNRYEVYFSDLQEGDLVAGIMEIPNSDNPNAAVFMRLDDIAPTYLPSLDEVRARVEGDFKRVKALEAARQKAEAVAAAAATLEDLQKAAAEAGKDLRQNNELIELDQIAMSDLPRIENFAADLVRTPEGKARVSGVQGFFGSAVNGYAVWMITEKQDADRAEFRQQMAQLQAELLNLKRQTLLNEFLASRRAGLKVEYNKMLLGDLAAAQ